jgi:predicted ATPase/DNA-binding SARP family transcriptional activator
MGSLFRILGPLEVDDAPALGGPKPRTLLARLLLQPNQVVAEDELVDTLWGEDPPERARHALQVYVSSLRRALGPNRIRRARGGYAAVVEVDELDLARFERLATEGRDLLEAGDAAGALSRLDEALSLWRGPALADVAPALESDRARLEEQRLVVLEDRLDAKLELGLHRDVVSELERFSADHPLRERIARQLMLALYRSGRQADALAVYRRTRDVLRDELGLEPGSELRKLETAILRHDESLDTRRAEQSASSRLPSPATPLIGRRLEIDAITSLLRGDARLVTITGPGGAGKTRVALQAADEVARDSAATAVFIDLAAVREPEAVPDAVAEELELTSATEIEGALRGSAFLLLLDNFEQVDAAAPFVGSLLTRAPRLRVLITSRQPLGLYGEHEYRLPPLDLETEAVPLFVARPGARGVDVSPSKTVVAICRALDCLPLAIELAAGRAGELTIDDMLGRLNERLQLPAAGPRDVPERHRTIAATIAWSYDLLPLEQQRPFVHLSVFTGGWETRAAAEVADADADSLATLVARSLALRTGGRFRMLETIRTFALDRLDELEDGETVRSRHARYFHGLAIRAKVELRGPNAPDWLARIDRERANLESAFEWLLANHPSTGVELADGLFLYWITRSRCAEGLRWYERALAPEEDALRAEMPKFASGLAFRCGDFDRAERYASEAHAVFVERDDHANLARIGGMFGLIASERGDYETALERLAASVEIARRANDPVSLGFALSNFGSTATAAGQLESAAAALEEALELVEAAPADAPRLADKRFVLQSLGTVDVLAGRLRKARERMDASIRIAIELVEPEGLAGGMLGLARLAVLEDQPERAAHLLGAADAVLADAGIELERFDVDERGRTVEMTTQRLGSERYQHLYGQGRTLSVHEARTVALGD